MFPHDYPRLISPVSFLDHDVDDLLDPLAKLMRNPGVYMRPWRSSASHKDAGSTVEYGKNKFQVSLDVQQFEPQEISVKVTGDNVITVEGKHEEKEDEYGFISRHFARRYIVPRGYEISKASSKLSSDGVLTITAPSIADDKEKHREIPIIKTGVPVKEIEKK